jgi:hypothetical protein
LVGSSSKIVSGVGPTKGIINWNWFGLLESRIESFDFSTELKPVVLYIGHTVLKKDNYV